MSEVLPENMIPGTEYYIETGTDYLPAPNGPDGPDEPDDPDDTYVSGVMKCIGTFMNVRIYEGKNAPFFCNIRMLPGAQVDLGLALLHKTTPMTNSQFDVINDGLTSTKCPFNMCNNNKCYKNSAFFPVSPNNKFFSISTPELQKSVAYSNTLTSQAATGDFTGVIKHVENSNNKLITQNPTANTQERMKMKKSKSKFSTPKTQTPSHQSEGIYSLPFDSDNGPAEANVSSYN